MGMSTPRRIGLKVQKRWLKRMQLASSPFEAPKNVEVRRYLPEAWLPQGCYLSEGDDIYLLCNGEVAAEATYSGTKTYFSPKDFEADALRHQVTLQTTPKGGPNLLALGLWKTT